MAAFVIATYDVVDSERYAGYVPAVLPLLEKHRAEVLVADYESQPLEGERRGVCVVLRFESEAAARAWYDDPEYAAPKGLRLRSTSSCSMILAKAWAPPAE